MHRSGTSGVAGALCAAGAWAGAADDLLPATPDNARGYFERTSVARSLEDSLTNLGGAWWNPPIEHLQPWAQQQVRPALRAALSATISEAPRGSTPLVKDPRLCLFASELKTLLADDWPVVVPVRHPLEVARSLHDRDGLSLQTGLALWEIYNGSLCAGLAGRPVHVVHYDLLLDDLTLTGELLDRVLGDGEPLAQPSYQRATAHLSGELRHHHADVADEDRWLSVSALRLWHQLEAASQVRNVTPLPSVEISHAAASFVRLEANRVQLEAVSRAQTDEVIRISADSSNIRTELDLLTEQLHASETSLSEQRSALAHALDDVGHLAQRVGELVEENERLTERIAGVRELRVKALEGWAEAEHEHIRLIETSRESEQRHRAAAHQMLVELDAARGELESLRSTCIDIEATGTVTVAAMRTRLQQTSNETSRLGAELAVVERHRQELIRDVNLICGSESWRLGHALTWPIRLIRRPRIQSDQPDSPGP